MMHRQSLGNPFSFAVLRVTIVSVLFFFSCDSKNSFPNPPGYDFSRPYVYRLPTALDEISGVAYYPKDNSVFAIQDEKGWLFKIHLGSPLKIERWKFSNSGDYEDVSLVDSQFFVLKSKGVIEKFKFSGDSLTLQSFKVPEDVKNEFETLFFDSSLRKLILVCKNCERDKKSDVSSWAFDPNTDSFSSSFTISTSKIREELDDNKMKFKPSAAAIDPLTGELYILASVNKALVILNKDHSVKNCYKIDPVLFKQPEGITFTPRGDLIISNEAGDKNSADMLFFQYHKPRKPQ
jgi:uncharacterized protein YjiK